MKKLSTSSVIGIWFITIFLVLGVALGIQWYHTLTQDTTQEIKPDTTYIVPARIVELHAYGYTVEYDGMQYNVTADISKVTLSDTIKIKLDTHGTESPFDDTLVCAFED